MRALSLGRIGGPSSEGRFFSRVPAGEVERSPSLRAVEGTSTIEVVGLSRRYVAHGHVTNVLDDFNLSIDRGSFVSIVGPSGCGKSTLLKLMAGLDAPTSGQIRFNGDHVLRPPTGVIYVFQQYSKSIFPWRTVRDNIAFGLEHHSDKSKAMVRATCEEYIRLVGLEGYGDHFPSQLSGGMQQRVAIARALVCKPEVLLMDEPFSAVDALTRATLQELLLKIWRAIDLTVIFVTHDVDEAVYLSDRVISLGRGGGGIVDDLAVPLPHPRHQVRTRSSPVYINLRERLLSRILAAENPVFAEPDPTNVEGATP